VQRFGAQPTDTLTLQAAPGDRLTLQFTQQNQPQTLTTNSVKLEIQMQPLSEPMLQERVVLSTHRSFESAEDSAQRWRSQGIPVEIAQPSRWQVWAKREVYNTPLLRRVLLTSLQKQGYVIPFLDSQVLKQVPQAAWIVNNTRYSNHPLQITAGKSPIQVKTGGRDPRNRSYAGQLRLQRNAYGNYTLVNQVPLETYLRGVVPHEIGQQAPQPAIEAQAILARTYALRNLRRFQIDNYQLCADTQCQV
jgi:peptidoglycan hydrolase-like amidase